MPSTIGIVLWLSSWFYAGVMLYHVDVYAKKHFKHPLYQRYFALASLAPTLLTPYLLPSSDKAMRGFLTMCTGFYFIRASEVLLLPRFKTEPPLFKQLHVGASFHDIQTRRPLKHKWKYFQKIILGLAISISELLLAITLLKARVFIPIRAVQYSMGSVSGAFFILSNLEIFGYVLALAFIPLDLQLPPLMDSPLASTSLKEFWGERWNSVIQQLLKDHVYMPLRYYNAPRSVGVMATFIASGLIHVYPLFVAGLDFRDAIFMLMYFVCQGALALVEAALLPKDLTKMERHVWTLCCTTLPSFLFAEPMYRLAGIKI